MPDVNPADTLWATSIIIGPGSPEGVLEAGIGALYIRTDGLSATEQFYLKSTDVGNTGWRRVTTVPA